MKTKLKTDLKFDKNPFKNKTEAKTFKLPYTGKYSNIAPKPPPPPKKNQNIVKTFSKDIDVTVALTPFKIDNKFS